LELWDLYNENREPLGKIHNRKDYLKTGEYHIAVSVWTVNSRGKILLTLRHPGKKEYPNYWENTAGSVITGETSTQGAVRELFEETGIAILEKELVFLGTENEPSAFVDSYILKKDISIGELTMQEGETVAAKWVSLEELDELITNGSIALPVVKRLDRVRGKFEEFLKKSNTDTDKDSLTR